MTLALAEGGADIVSIELPDDTQSGELEKQVKALGRSITKFPCNVKDSKQLRSTFEKIQESGVKGDILLNCAGVPRPSVRVTLS